MVLAPLFEFLIILALTTQAFGTLTNNYIFDQQRSQAGQVAADMGNVAHYVQSWCDGNSSNCTGVTFALMVTAKEMSSAQSTAFGNEMTVAASTDANGGNNNFLLVSSQQFLAGALNQFPTSAGTKSQNTGTYLCFSPGIGGIYKSTAATCT